MAAASDNVQHMQAAIKLSERAGIVEKTGRCFGAVVVKDNQIIGEGYNQVGKNQHRIPCLQVQGTVGARLLMLWGSFLVTVKAASPLKTTGSSLLAVRYLRSCLLLQRKLLRPGCRRSSPPETQAEVSGDIINMTNRVVMLILSRRKRLQHQLPRSHSSSTGRHPVHLELTCTGTARLAYRFPVQLLCCTPLYVSVYTSYILLLLSEANSRVVLPNMSTAADHQHFMRAAIQLSAEAGLVDHQDCFGAVVVKDGQIIGQGSNQVPVHWHNKHMVLPATSTGALCKSCTAQLFSLLLNKREGGGRG